MVQSYIIAHDAMPKHQSAYRQLHSTEMTLIKIFNDLLQAVDWEQVSTLYLFHLTAASDYVDNEVLISQLECRFGLRDRYLAWFVSYSSEHTTWFSKVSFPKWSMSSAQYHKVQSWACCYSYCNVHSWPCWAGCLVRCYASCFCWWQSTLPTL